MEKFKDIDYYWPSFFPEKEKVMFLDIETTGLSARSAMIYMIGTIVYKDGSWVLNQYFAEKLTDEKEILQNIYNLLNEKIIIAFNGNTFDIPFIISTYKQYHLELPDIKSIDLLKLLRPYKEILGLANVKQVTFERLLNISREGDRSGGELIPVYEGYLKNSDEESKRMLLYHNNCDMKGMLRLLDIFRLNSIMDSYEICLVNKNIDELCINIDIGFELSFYVEINNEDIYIRSDKNKLELRCPIADDTVKMYFANYKDYFYLPMEDRAIHKSLAEFVDKGYKVKAKKVNCYSHERVDAVIAERSIRKYISSLLHRFLYVDYSCLKI